MVCEICNKVIDPTDIDVQEGESPKNGSLKLTSMLHLPGNGISEVEMNFCGLKCFCAYAIKIAISNHEEMGMDFSDYNPQTQTIIGM